VVVVHCKGLSWTISIIFLAWSTSRKLGKRNPVSRIVLIPVDLF